jgi:hypothetical protein
MERGEPCNQGNELLMVLFIILVGVVFCCLLSWCSFQNSGHISQSTCIYILICFTHHHGATCVAPRFLPALAQAKICNIHKMAFPKKVNFAGRLQHVPRDVCNIFFGDPKIGKRMFATRSNSLCNIFLKNPFHLSKQLCGTNVTIF